MHELENDPVRSDLGARAIACLDACGISREAQREVLALSPDEWRRVQLGAPLPLQLEVLERAELVVALSERLSVPMLTAPLDDLGGLSPAAVLRRSDADGLERLRAWLQAARVPRGDRPG